MAPKKEQFYEKLNEFLAQTKSHVNTLEELESIKRFLLNQDNVNATPNQQKNWLKR